MTVVEQRPQFGVNYDVGYDGFTARPKDFIAAGIKWFTRWDAIPGVPPVSHALKIVGEDLTIEAFGDGVHYGKLSDYLNDPNVCLIVRKPKGWTPEMGARLKSEAEKHLGEKYNYPLIVALAICNTYLGKWIDNKLKGKLSEWLQGLADRKRYDICSVCVAKMNNEMPELQGKGVLAQPLYDITPIMLCGDQEIYEPGAVELIP